MSKRILLLSGHLFRSKRKAGFHHLAEAMVELGMDVSFVTVPNSLYSVLKSESSKWVRLAAWLYSIQPISIGKIRVSSYISLIHNLAGGRQLFSKIHYNLFKIGYCRLFREKFDVIIFESGVSLFLFDRLEKYNPSAKLVYRVSDDLIMLKHDFMLVHKEKEILRRFLIVSSPSSTITERLRLHSPANTETFYHGLNKQSFDDCYENPYDTGYVNFVFVGTGYFDYQFLKYATDVLRNSRFYIIGNIPRSVVSDNIIYFGEMKFQETVAYIKFADIGLQTRQNVNRIATLEKSLKYLQYCYAKLPIIAPKYMNLIEQNVFSYECDYQSVACCIHDALLFDRSSYDNGWIQGWDQLARNLSR